MSLRIRKRSPVAAADADAPLRHGPGATYAADGDNWAARIGKLIPAEVLGVYGAAPALCSELEYRPMDYLIHSVGRGYGNPVLRDG